MKDSKHKLMVQQLDRKMEIYNQLLEVNTPNKGWLHTIRKAYRMSLRQFSERLGVTPPAVEGYEKREKSGNITLKSLEDAGRALNMKLVYGFVPIDGSIQKTIEIRAKEIALDIIKTTSNSMALEDQKNSNERLQKAVEEKTKQLIDEMPRYLWD